MIASKARRIHALNSPQSTLCLVHMELLVVPFVCNIWFQDFTHSGRDSMISFVRIGLRDCDVVDDNSDERISCIQTAADVNVIASQFDDIHNGIKRW
jgi:hypothetical protein